MPQSEDSKSAENTAQTTVKITARKRARHLMPELREQIPGLFDRCAAEDVAEQFGVPVRDVLEESLRDLRRHVLRRGPQSERGAQRPYLVMRSGGAA